MVNEEKTKWKIEKKVTGVILPRKHENEILANWDFCRVKLLLLQQLFVWFETKSLNNIIWLKLIYLSISIIMRRHNWCSETHLRMFEIVYSLPFFSSKYFTSERQITIINRSYFGTVVWSLYTLKIIIIMLNCFVSK